MLTACRVFCVFPNEPNESNFSHLILLRGLVLVIKADDVLVLHLGVLALALGARVHGLLVLAALGARLERRQLGSLLQRGVHLVAHLVREPVVLERQRSQRAVVAQPGGERLTTRVLDCVVLEIEISEHAVEREPLAEGARPAVL